MIPQDGALLAALPAMAFGFGLVIARVGAAMTLLPALGEVDLPVIVRMGLALSLTLLVLPGALRLMPSVPPEPMGAAAMVGAELLTGLWLSWLARLLTQALPIAGQMISYMLGLSNVLQPDPALGVQSTVLARLFGLAAPVILLSTGLYRLPVAALADSYRLIPPGTLVPIADASRSIVDQVGRGFALALQLATPFLLAGIVWQVGLALLARLVPRVQTYATAMPAQIVGGLFLLSLLAAGILQAWQDAVRDGFARLPGL